MCGQLKFSQGELLDRSRPLNRWYKTRVRIPARADPMVSAVAMVAKINHWRNVVGASKEARTPLLTSRWAEARNTAGKYAMLYELPLTRDLYPLQLEDLVYSTLGMKCQDPLDKVYALLPITPLAPGASQTLLLAPDYVESIDAVHENLASASMEKYRSLNILRYVEHGEGPIKLPSWVPGWDTFDPDKSIVRPVPPSVPSQREQPTYSSITPKGALRLYGRTVSVIKALSPEACARQDNRLGGPNEVSFSYDDIKCLQPQLSLLSETMFEAVVDGVKMWHTHLFPFIPPGRKLALIDRVGEIRDLEAEIGLRPSTGTQRRSSGSLCRYQDPICDSRSAG